MISYVYVYDNTNQYGEPSVRAHPSASLKNPPEYSIV